MKTYLLILIVAIFAISCGNNNSAVETESTDKTEKPTENTSAEVENHTEEPAKEIMEEITYDKYCNGRYNFCVEYPKDILIPQGESDNGDGQKFVSEDKSRELIAWGELNVLEETLEERMEEVAGEIEVEDKELSDNYFVVFGKKDGKQYYQKTKTIEDGFATFVVTFPEDKAHSCNKVIERIAKSF